MDIKKKKKKLSKSEVKDDYKFLFCVSEWVVIHVLKWERSDSGGGNEFVWPHEADSPY